jgi:glucose/arabinose dehydrogenase
VLQPKQTLDANTGYRLEIQGVKDFTSATFLPFTTSFTTGTATQTSTLTNVQFSQIALPTSAGTSYTTVTFGPDGKLYASTIDGLIYRFAVNSDGTLATPQILDSLQKAEGGQRMVVGLAFDPSSTPSNLIAWVSNNAYAINSAPDWSGKITRLSGADLGTVKDYVVGLPRSIRDHMTNSLVFGPDSKLYALQGSNTAMGAEDTAWGDRPEHLLNAALLRVDLSAIASPPLDVKTEDGGTYNPFAANAPLTIYSSGLRNAYDMVWHSNGRLYVPTNGSSSGGNTPGTPSPLPASCSSRIDGSVNGAYTGPTVPALTSVGTQPDFLFSVVKGGYYGHPNPARCEWTLNGGNPTNGVDDADVPAYPSGTAPDRNWRGFAYDFGPHFSPNGAIEYKGNAFAGSLRGKVLVARYSAGDDIIALTPGGANLNIVAADAGIVGLEGFTDPIDLTENPNGNGDLYVSEFGAQKLTLLRPVATSSTAGLTLQNLDGVPFDDRLVFNRIGTLANPPTNGVHDRATLRLRNTGTGPLTINGLPISGPWQLVSPPALPATIAAGASLDLTVRFIAETGRVSAGTLTIQSNDASAPSKVVQLAGYWQSLSENGQEPTLAEIIQIMGYQTAITSPGQSLNQDGFVRATGDEVLAPYWVRVDTSKPVSVRQLAAFHSCFNLATLQWFDKGSATRTGVVTMAGGDCQSLLQRKSDGSGNPAAGTFAPSGSFGLGVDGSEFSDPTLNNTGPDFSNGCPGPCGHHVRFWAVKDRNGNVVPNTWLMSMDYAGVNYDYNDNVYLISNMKPAPEQALYRLDVAGSANYTDMAGNVWTPDTGYFTPSTARPEGADYPVQAIANTNDDKLFTTYRAFTDSSIPVNQRLLEYNLPLSGVTRVNVRLYYAERVWTSTGQRVANVDVEGKRVSTNFDIFKQAPGTNSALIVPVYHVSVSDGTLTLDFRTVVDFAAINAIEVVADP